MKILKNCIVLSSKVQIYVPTTINIDEPMETSAWVDKAIDLLANQFGGATVARRFGAWQEIGKGIVKEDIYLVSAYCDEGKLQAGIEKIYDFCLEMKDQLKQAAIALEVNNQLYFI